MIATQHIKRLGEVLKSEGLKLVTCESMTGGLLAATITSAPGASEFYLGGTVAYSYHLKEWIGVPQEVLRTEGTISYATAEHMALSSLKLWRGELLALSVTGNAGPTALEGKPVGLFYLGWAVRYKGEVRSGAEEHRLSGSRDEVREGAVIRAVELALKLISEI